MTQQQQPHSPALARLVLVMMVIALAGGLTAGILALAGSNPHSPTPPENRLFTEEEENCMYEHDTEYYRCEDLHCKPLQYVNKNEEYQECQYSCLKKAGC